MLSKVLIITLIAAGVVLLCWALAEYWLRTADDVSPAKISNLGFWDRIGFAFQHFCQTITDSKKLEKTVTKEELSKIPLEKKNAKKTVSAERKAAIEKEHGKESHEKNYKMKMNMKSAPPV